VGSWRDPKARLYRVGATLNGPWRWPFEALRKKVKLFLMFWSRSLQCLIHTMVSLAKCVNYYGMSNGQGASLVSNSSGKFWDALQREGLDAFESAPARAGDILLRLVEQWHNAVDISHCGTVDTRKSFYLVLQWDEKTLTYRLFQYVLTLPDPVALSWSAQGRRLVGEDASGIIVEWYGYSGGQLKYYPPVEQAIWASETFTLEPLPRSDEEYGVLRRVREYYPELWERACMLA